MEYPCRQALPRGCAWLGKLSFWLLALALPALSQASSAAPSLHAEVLVFVPAYEGSQLFDPTLDADKSDPPCVWGSLNVFLSSKLYFAMRLPNSLIAKTMLAVGPVDIYRKFVETMTQPQETAPHFSAYTLGADFFIFDYDWRQEIATVSAPQLARALESYAQIHASRTGIPARETRFVIVTHSMGGLVARTLLAEKPEWASRISRLYLVGSPNAGSVKAIKTVVEGPESIESVAHGFPGMLLNLVPSDVDQNVTKLTGITRPSLYELLPFGDPHWQERTADGGLHRMTSRDVLSASSWQPYWPSADLEKRLFLDDWLKEREAEGRKHIDPAAWAYCQDPSEPKLKAMLAQTIAFRRLVGPLSHTRDLLTRPGESSRMKVIFSTGLATPDAVVTEGAHDASQGYYLYGQAGDGTMESRRVIDDLATNSPLLMTMHGVPHGRLMIDPQFLTYFTRELSDQPMTAMIPKAQP
jgi:pimeloyl-ACP methyl ester carboxylesterase